MKHQLRYRIKTLSPIILPHISGDTNMVSTMDYIPGSVILGIFANKYVKENKLGSDAHKDSNFHSWFLNSNLCFTNAYLSKMDGAAVAEYYPVPFSINYLKTDENQIFDLIFKEIGKENDNEIEKENDNEIDKQTKYPGSYCYIENNNIRFASVNRSINFHNARKNRLKGRSDDGAIFNYESIDQNQEFTGRIIGTEKELKLFLEKFESEMKVRIGRSKSIQYGQAVLTLLSNEPEIFVSEIPSFQLEKVNSTFSLTLLSSTIIYDRNGFPSTSLIDLKSYLADNLKVNLKNIKIVKAFTKSEIVETFVSKWLLKKPSETAIKAGSCLLINVEGFDDNTKNSLLELLEIGIGERTGEGFGRFAINLQEPKEYSQPKTRKHNLVKPEKPDVEIPDTIRDLMKNVILNSYDTLIESRALSRCKGFCENKNSIPSNSLLGKLESMIKDSSNSEELVKKMDKLPGLTREKLEKCRDKNINLFNFINSRESGILEDLNPEADLKGAGTLIDLNLENDSELRFKMYSHYWLTFLASMRKEIKMRNEGGD
ncbi:RAMP superfamily CRISPR-associated protein [Methanosarcina barkeri]